MKKVFFALLFLSLLGAAVLIWLIRTAPSSPSAESSVHIVDEKHEEAAKVAEGVDEKKSDEKKSDDKKDEVKPAEAESSPKPAEAAADKPVEKAPENPVEKSAPAASHTLSIHTEPTGAKVWVDGKERGVTPFDLPLTELTQMVQIEAEGYVDFTRVAPSQTDSGNGDLNWKIQLKKKAEPEAAKKTEAVDDEAVAKPAPAPVAAVSQPIAKKINKKAKARAPRGPYYVQLKSLPRAGMKEDDLRQAVAQLRLNLSSKDDVFECRVNLPGKGEYIRILVGPFASKILASERLLEYKKLIVDAYVTGAQKCLR